MNGVQAQLGFEGKVVEFGVAFTLTGTGEQFKAEANQISLSAYLKGI